MSYQNVLLNLKTYTINIFVKMPKPTPSSVDSFLHAHYPLRPGYNTLTNEDLELLKETRIFMKLLEDPDIYLNDTKANLRYQTKVDETKANNAEYTEWLKKREVERPIQDAQAKIAELERKLSDLEYHRNQKSSKKEIEVEQKSAEKAV